MGVAVAIAGGDAELERFAEHAEQDRVLARVVAGADGVVADFVSRPRAGATGAAVRCSVISIASADDLAELERGAARRVFFEAVMTLDDFDVDAGRQIAQRLGGDFGELHRHVDGRAHAGRPDDRNFLGRFRDVLLLFAFEAGRGDDDGLA